MEDNHDRDIIASGTSKSVWIYFVSSVSYYLLFYNNWQDLKNQHELDSESGPKSTWGRQTFSEMYHLGGSKQKYPG